MRELEREIKDILYINKCSELVCLAFETALATRRNAPLSANLAPLHAQSLFRAEFDRL